MPRLMKIRAWIADIHEPWDFLCNIWNVTYQFWLHISLYPYNPQAIGPSSKVCLEFPNQWIPSSDLDDESPKSCCFYHFVSLCNPKEYQRLYEEIHEYLGQLKRHLDRPDTELKYTKKNLAYFIDKVFF